jgi:hypothetical protein
VLLKVRWVIPFIGSAIGAVFAIYLSDVAWRSLKGVAEVRKINVEGFASAGTVILGFVASLVLCLALVKRDGRRANNNEIPIEEIGVEHA